MPDKGNEPDITVIGAGIIGICTGLSLRERGATVQLIDRHAPGSGASYGNAGVVSPWSCVPQAVPGLWRQVPDWLFDADGPLTVKPAYWPRFLPWALRFLGSGSERKVWRISAAMSGLMHGNMDLYRRHLAGTGHEDLLRDSWYVQAFRGTPPSPETLGWRLRAAIDTPMALVDGDELREIEPALAADYDGALLIKDQARITAPGALCDVLAAKFQQMGGRITRAEVQKITPHADGGWRIQRDDVTERADKLVLAAGAWSARLLAPLGLAPPLEAERGYHVVFQNPDVTLNHSVMDGQAMIVASSMDMGLRSAGTAEFAGLDAPPDARRAASIARQTRRMLPGLRPDEPAIWMGHRPSMPDSLPCLGAVPGFPGLLAAFGHSHYGIGMAPMTGQLIAMLALGQQPNIDMAPYGIDRFG